MTDIGNPGWITLIGTLFAGVGLKATEAWLNRNVSKEDVDTRMRNELREQIKDLNAELTRLRTEIDSIETQLDLWKEKFWKLTEESVQIKADYAEAIARLQTLKQRGVDTDSNAVLDSTHDKSRVQHLPGNGDIGG